jgi:hypothetical protein
LLSAGIGWQVWLEEEGVEIVARNIGNTEKSNLFSGIVSKKYHYGRTPDNVFHSIIVWLILT